ncbi:ComF family protein [Pseudoneobacillus sp. C159]
MSWIDLIKKSGEEMLCSECLERLERIEGERCEICFRPLELLEPRYRVGKICLDCCRWEEDNDYKGILNKNYSLYVYNEFLKEIIAKFKYRGDYALAKIFAKDIKKLIKESNPDLIIPIPLSNERLEERGFNQAEALITEAQVPLTKALTRFHSEKQSKKSRQERIHLPQVFQTTIDISGKVILVDDIYTTGSTLRHAARALKEAGATEIIAITVARG